MIFWKRDTRLQTLIGKLQLCEDRLWEHNDVSSLTSDTYFRLLLNISCIAGRGTLDLEEIGFNLKDTLPVPYVRFRSPVGRISIILLHTDYVPDVNSLWLTARGPKEGLSRLKLLQKTLAQNISERVQDIGIKELVWSNVD